MAESEQLTQFWLELFKASCHLSIKEDAEDDDFRPLYDYLIPKPEVAFSLDEKSIQPQGNTVEFLNLKKYYEKVQTRRDGISAQRPMDCNIRILVDFDPAWISQNVDVFVQRHPESAKLCGDFNGRVKLKVKREVTKRGNLEYFSVDLDSVYKSQYDRPVYKLSTVDPVRRNRFLLIVRLSSLEQNKFQHFKSSPFLVRSRKPTSATLKLKPPKKIKLSRQNNLPQ